MAEPKEKPATSLRSPQPKKKLGLSVPSALRMPHDDLIKAEYPSSSTSTPSRPRTSSIAPERDFQRVPNSITREAMPQGLFRGKSKQVYDYLYHQTRGAITPKRSVRKSRKEILKGSGLGSMVTVDAAVNHLRNVGLLDVRPAVGSLNGNEYQIFTPEEATTRSSSYTSTTSLTQKVDNLVLPESGSTSITQLIDTPDSYSEPKTKIKDKDHIDDEAFAGLVDAFRKITTELTGKTPTATENAKWKELAEVLVAEVRIAAGRTTVSSVPAFLAEHLRRRLWKLDKKQAAREGKELPDQTPVKLNIPEGQMCPDCSNTGWWFPEGPEKGVAKCKHTALNVPSPEGE
jgi:hypothetical protein